MQEADEKLINKLGLNIVESKYFIDEQYSFKFWGPCIFTFGSGGSKFRGEQICLDRPTISSSLKLYIETWHL